MNIQKKLVACLALLAGAYLLSPAKVELPSVIGSNMVLQQKSDVALWGTASPFKTVTIKASWTRKKFTVQAGPEGRWLIRIPTPSAGGPYEISFSDGEEVAISNVLTGEVWYCSGQSNMEMPMKGNHGQGVDEAAETIMSAREDVPIRLYKEKHNIVKDDHDICAGEWNLNNSKSVANISAVAYFFARTLYESLQVPIGIIESDWGGTPIEAWMDRKTLQKFGGEVSLERPEEAVQNRPMALYNAMVAPLVPFTFKGMLWYQGESNRDNPELYSRLQPAYVEMMRENFCNPDAGFYYVQIAPHRYRGFETRMSPVFQQMQTENQDVIPHSAMAGTEDIGLEMLIHPKQKKQVGQRLAWLALTKDYGVEGIDPYVPRVEKIRYEEGKAYITFDSPRGLVPFRTDLPGFELAGEDKVFHDAKAQVLFLSPFNDNRTVCVSCEDVSEPIAVRYCFHDWAEGILTNTFGIPAAPFRTDNWECIRTDW